MKILWWILTVFSRVVFTTIYFSFYASWKNSESVGWGTGTPSEPETAVEWNVKGFNAVARNEGKSWTGHGTSQNQAWLMERGSSHDGWNPKEDHRNQG